MDYLWSIFGGRGKKWGFRTSNVKKSVLSFLLFVFYCHLCTRKIKDRASLSLHKNRTADIYILQESLMRTIRLFLFMITICMTLSSCELLCLFLDEAIDSKNEQKKKTKKTKKQKTVEKLNTAYPTL